MKELSIKEKAKRYDEAKYIMKEYLESGNAGVIAENTIKKAFPEFAESEDERIRKDLLNFLKSPFIKDNICDWRVAPWIAWLERQCSQISANSAKTCKVEQKPVDKVEPKFKKE